MFRSPFKFNGRIRRTEYFLSVLFFYGGLFIFIVALDGLVRDSGTKAIITLSFFLPCAVFMLAQGVKRSHDAGNSGWFLLIPLYGFILLFADSQVGENKYGLNPKGIGNDIAFSFESDNETMIN